VCSTGSQFVGQSTAGGWLSAGVALNAQIKAIKSIDLIALSGLRDINCCRLTAREIYEIVTGERHKGGRRGLLPRCMRLVPVRRSVATRSAGHPSDEITI